MKKKVIEKIEPRLFTIKQSAAYLNATIWFVRTAIWNRELPSIKLGKRALIDRKDLDSFIDERKMDRD